MRRDRVHDRFVAVCREGEKQYVVVPRETLRVVRHARAERGVDCAVRDQFRAARERCGALAGR